MLCGRVTTVRKRQTNIYIHIRTHRYRKTDRRTKWQSINQNHQSCTVTTVAILSPYTRRVCVCVCAGISYGRSTGLYYAQVAATPSSIQQLNHMHALESHRLRTHKHTVHNTHHHSCFSSCDANKYCSTATRNFTRIVQYISIKTRDAEEAYGDTIPLCFLFWKTALYYYTSRHTPSEHSKRVIYCTWNTAWLCALECYRS